MVIGGAADDEKSHYCHLKPLYIKTAFAIRLGLFGLDKHDTIANLLQARVLAN